MPSTKDFIHQSAFSGTVERLIEFHQSQNAFSQLVPPPMFIQTLQDSRSSLTDGEIEFKLWVGPLPFRWRAVHEAGPTEHSFTDRMVTGPMAYWKHDHIFEAKEEGVQLTDHVSLAHKPGLLGLFTRLLFDGLPLRFFFMYRHWVTRKAMRA